VFRGHFRHTIDPKGRLSIPAKFRDALADGHGEKLVIVPNGTALEVHPLQLWQELENKVNTLPRFDPLRREIQYRYLSRGQDVTLDPQGRIQIPADYRERAGLVKDVVIIGMSEKFEVWDAERWAHRERESAGPLDDLFAKLADRGI
jgi:MraZ protein